MKKSKLIPVVVAGVVTVVAATTGLAGCKTEPETPPIVKPVDPCGISGSECAKRATDFRGAVQAEFPIVMADINKAMAAYDSALDAAWKNKGSLEHTGGTKCYEQVMLDGARTAALNNLENTMQGLRDQNKDVNPCGIDGSGNACETRADNFKAGVRTELEGLYTAEFELNKGHIDQAMHVYSNTLNVAWQKKGSLTHTGGVKCYDEDMLNEAREAALDNLENTMQELREQNKDINPCGIEGSGNACETRANEFRANLQTELTQTYNAKCSPITAGDITKAMAKYDTALNVAWEGKNSLTHTGGVKCYDESILNQAKTAAINEMESILKDACATRINAFRIDLRVELAQKYMTELPGAATAARDADVDKAMAAYDASLLGATSSTHGENKCYDNATLGQARTAALNNLDSTIETRKQEQFLKDNPCGQSSGQCTTATNNFRVATRNQLEEKYALEFTPVVTTDIDRAMNEFERVLEEEWVAGGSKRHADNNAKCYDENMLNEARLAAMEELENILEDLRPVLRDPCNLPPESCRGISNAFRGTLEDDLTMFHVNNPILGMNNLSQNVISAMREYDKVLDEAWKRDGAPEHTLPSTLTEPCYSTENRNEAREAAFRVLEKIIEDTLGLGK